MMVSDFFSHDKNCLKSLKITIHFAGREKMLNFVSF